MSIASQTDFTGRLWLFREPGAVSAGLRRTPGPAGRPLSLIADHTEGDEGRLSPQPVPDGVCWLNSQSHTRDWR
jgi:hypothetical protein